MFDIKEHIKKCKPVADKLLTYLNNKEIKCSLVDETGHNLVFTKRDKQIKMSHHSFYRFSGIACRAIIVGKESENKSEYIEVTYDTYLNTIIRPIIELRLN